MFRMRDAVRVGVMVGAPLVMVALIFVAVAGACRVLELPILAAEIGCLVCGWLYAYDESRFPRAFVFAGRFCVLAGLLIAVLGADFGTGFVMIFAGLVMIRRAANQGE